MSFFMLYLVPIATLVVAVVLVLGLYNLLKGGSPNRSQMLMRWRIIAQAIAVVIALIAAWLASGRS